MPQPPLRPLRDADPIRSRVQSADRLVTLGRMAEGVAHDFNNLLTVIVGCAAELLDESLSANESRDMAEQIREAGQRAVGLTRQLLVFGREQGGDPQLVDASECVANLSRLLQRVLAPAYSFEPVLTTGLPRVEVDPGRFEQAIVLLVLSARDALPNGGRIQVETSAGPAGSENGVDEPSIHVVVRARDAKPITVSTADGVARDGEAAAPDEFAAVRAIALEADGWLEGVPHATDWALRLGLPGKVVASGA